MKIVRKKMLELKKTFEIITTIYSNMERSEQFLKHNNFSTQNKFWKNESANWNKYLECKKSDIEIAKRILENLEFCTFLDF